MRLTFARLVMFYSLVVLLVTGCSNDLDVLIPAAPIPNIICIVNPLDSFCTLTISRTVQADSNAIGLINNNQQLRVDNASIVLEAWGEGYPLWETSFSLIPNDGRSGLGLQSSRSLYISDKVMRFSNLPAVDTLWNGPYDYFRLKVTSPQFGQIAYSRIPVIKKPKLISPKTPRPWSLYGVNDPELVVKVDLEEMKYASLLCWFFFEEYTDHWEQKSVQFTVQKDLAMLVDEQKWICIGPPASRT